MQVLGAATWWVRLITCADHRPHGHCDVEGVTVILVHLDISIGVVQAVHEHRGEDNLVAYTGGQVDRAGVAR